MNMDVFCNDDMIQFRDSKPLTCNENEQQFQFNGKKALQELIINLEKSSAHGILTIWSEDQYDKMLNTFFSFHEMVEAAGGVVFNENSEILFIHRNGKWDLPKGKISGKDRRKAEKDSAVKPGKSDTVDFEEQVARIAAIREVNEETGMKTLKISGDLPSTYHVYFIDNRRIVKHTRWFRMEGSSENTLKPQISEGIIIARWVPVKSLGCIFEHTYESLKPLIKSVLANT